jgi:hypothetical protein
VVDDRWIGWVYGNQFTVDPETSFTLDEVELAGRHDHGNR